MSLTDLLGKLPKLTGALDYTNFSKHLSKYQDINVNCGSAIIPFKSNVNMVQDNYSNGVYSPTQNRIYLMPHMQAFESYWHYIDCDTGEYVPYEHGIPVELAEFAMIFGNGVYSPTQDRIYLVPVSASVATVWFYIDCKTGKVVQYDHGITYTEQLSYNPDTEEWTGGYVDGMFTTGVYSPTQDRIYLLGHYGPNWYYIDCATDTVVAYDPGLAAFYAANPGFQYFSGCYSPTQNRIYLIPFFPATTPTTWHYIDCDTGLVVAYTHGLIADSNPGMLAALSAVYAPIQNRIYVCPYDFGSETWFYIDCSDGSIVQYEHNLTLSYDVGDGNVLMYLGEAPFSSGCYSPSQNKIYFVGTVLVTINCDDNAVTVTQLSETVRYRAVGYSSTQNSVYLTAAFIFDPGVPIQLYIQEFSTPNIAPQIVAHSMLSNI